MNNNSISKNKYFICLKSNLEAVIDWDLYKVEPDIIPDCNYWKSVFKNMEKMLKIDNLVFYLTFDLNQLPSYGSNVIAVVLGDEWCRIPSYSHKVRAIFKCYGTQLILGCNLLKQASYLNLLTSIHFVKTWFNRFPSLLKYKIRCFIFPQKYINLYDIPLGYYKQLDLPIRNIEQRLYDIYFAGSIYQEQYSVRSLKYLLQDPKMVSRKIMLKNLNEFKEKYPDIKIKTAITSGFHQTTDNDAINYSKDMMNSKICLVPRGTSFETYRFFEALRSGCIIIGENLPSRWFYNDSPYIRISKWGDLESILLKLTGNSKVWEKKHQESLNWWQEKCSEEVVGKYIAEKINEMSSVTD